MSFSFLGSLASYPDLPIAVLECNQAKGLQDLMNYNQAQQGQLSNAFTEGTWQQRLDQFRDSTVNSNLNMLGNMMDFRTKWLYQPYQEQQAQAWSTYGPWLAPIGPQSQWNMWQMLQQQPNLGQIVSGNTPSGVR